MKTPIAQPSALTNLYHQIANGNEQAESFLWTWGCYLRAVDDVIDEGKWEPEEILRVMMLACTFYSHPFYVAHSNQLQMPVIVATNFWLDSIKWEKEAELWKRQWADVMRHSGNEVILAVAMIAGGWEGIREFSAPLMAMCYCYHADKHGVPDNPSRQLTMAR